MVKSNQDVIVSRDGWREELYLGNSQYVFQIASTKASWQIKQKRSLLKGYWVAQKTEKAR